MRSDSRAVLDRDTAKKWYQWVAGENDRKYGDLCVESMVYCKSPLLAKTASCMGCMHGMI